MKTVEIQLDLILPKTNFMRDSSDRYDILGQIYYAGGIEVPVNTRTPQEIDRVCYPFTIKERQTILNSPLTLAILALNNLSPAKQLKEANLLLAPHKWRLITFKELEELRQNAE